MRQPAHGIQAYVPMKRSDYPPTTFETMPIEMKTGIYRFSMPAAEKYRAQRPFIAGKPPFSGWPQCFCHPSIGILQLSPVNQSISIFLSICTCSLRLSDVRDRTVQVSGKPFFPSRRRSRSTSNARRNRGTQ